jgi:hypothetical protein
MKRLIASLLVGAALVLASTSASAASCPNGYHPHTVGDGDHEHGEHQHVGVSMDDVDRNENGYICVKHIGPSGAIHVHIDDSIP